MQFFNGSRFIEYPEEKQLLKDQIFKDALGNHKGVAARYFNAYFSGGGDQEHPVLGDLLKFVDEFYLRWDRTKQGTNKVPELILHRLDELNQASQREIARTPFTA